MNVIVGLDVLRHFHVAFNKGSFSVVAAATGSESQVVAEATESRSQGVRPPEELTVEGKNFKARFQNGYWEAKWDWREEPTLSQNIGQYAVSPELRPEFEKGVNKWIANEWLRERKTRSTEVPGQRRPAVPLMAVHQPTKRKVRPVMDYREVNEYVDASGSKADVCAEKMREWRRFPVNSSTIDIRDAYMQIRVDPECSQYQTVRYKGREYELTRMGFGLNCSPQILKEVVSAVLAVDPEIKRRRVPTLMTSSSTRIKSVRREWPLIWNGMACPANRRPRSMSRQSWDSK